MKRRRDRPVFYPFRPQILAVIIAIPLLVWLIAEHPLIPLQVVIPAISGLTGIAGYLIGKDRGDG